MKRQTQHMDRVKKYLIILLLYMVSIDYPVKTTNI